MKIRILAVGCGLPCDPPAGGRVHAIGTISRFNEGTNLLARATERQAHRYRKKLIVGYKSWVLPAMNGCSPNQQPGKEPHMKLYYAPAPAPWRRTSWLAKPDTPSISSGLTSPTRRPPTAAIIGRSTPRATFRLSCWTTDKS